MDRRNLLMYCGSRFCIWNPPLLCSDFENCNSCQLGDLATGEQGTIDVHFSWSVGRWLRPSKLFHKESMKVEILQDVREFS